MTPQEIIEYYESLLIVQYSRQTRAVATVGTMVGEVVADSIITQVRDAFDLDDAAGEQLDMIGLYRGIKRFVYALDVTKSFFATPSYTDSNPGSYKGLADYSMSEVDVTWYFMQYQDGTAIVYRMNDEEFRSVIKFKSEVDSMYMSVESIDTLLEKYFENYVTMIDDGDMSISYNNSPSNPDHLFDLVNGAGILPKPAGVSYSVTNV